MGEAGLECVILAKAGVGFGVAFAARGPRVRGDDKGCGGLRRLRLSGIFIKWGTNSSGARIIRAVIFCGTISGCERVHKPRLV